MGIAAAVALPILIFCLPVLLIASPWMEPGYRSFLVHEGLLGLPFSSALWWIVLRRICDRPGGFVMPWIVFLITCGALALHWGLL
jgi:hypothetical protein